jgi:hypothetical protein
MPKKLKKSKKPKKPKPPQPIKQSAFLPLVPDRFYRRGEVVANRYLGYGHTQLEEKIRAGEIEPPIALSKSGRATGWFGRYLIKRQAELEAAGKRTEAA